jgi:hypothetical protein
LLSLVFYLGVCVVIVWWDKFVVCLCGCFVFVSVFVWVFCICECVCVTFN